MAVSFWNTLAFPWQACMEEAWSAYRAGSVPIGAVVTAANGKILSRGRNRISESIADGGYLYGQTLAHAELNALVTLPGEDVDRHSCILYSTFEPCPLCLGALYMSSVREIRYAARDPFAGSVNLLGKTPYLSRKPIKVIGPVQADLEVLNIGWHAEYSLRERGEQDKGIIMLLDTWREVVPLGVRLGERLFHSGILRQLEAAGASVDQVVDKLADVYREDSYASL
jgi:tRNA(adenine34) deaminase